MELQLRAAALLLLLATCLHCVVGKRTKEKIYDPISGASCFRRLNGTHQTGCSSEQSGSVGVLHLIQIDADIDFLLQSGLAPPYAPLIPPHLFTRKNLLRLKQAAKNISAVLLINRTDKMTQFSHELQCPNQYSGIIEPNSTCDMASSIDSISNMDTWNPWGTGLLHEDFPFPIYYIADVDEIDKLVNCFEKFNNFGYETHSKRSLCAVEVNSFMSAAVSAEVCIRRSNFMNNLGRTKYCDPLEGRNVYATLFSRKIISNISSGEGQSDSETTAMERKVDPNEKFILVTCRMDTTSMFDGIGPGAMDSLLGYATLINTAHMLARLLPDKNSLKDKNINLLFLIFNGESYDYIGSQRFRWDLLHAAFPTASTLTAPISLENIEFMIDIGTLDDISTIKVHRVAEFPAASAFLTILQKYGKLSNYNFNISFASAIGLHMPPTSAQSFLRHDNRFKAVVLNAPPTNRYYHSIYDDIENVNFTYANTSRDFSDLMNVSDGAKYFPFDSVQMKIRNISSVIAMALYETLTSSTYSGSRIVSPILVDELLYCFLHSADCPLFKAASHPKSLPGLPIPPTRYISVADGPQESSGWTYRLLGYLLSHEVTNRTENNCTLLPLHWFAGYKGLGQCRLTTQNYSYALSPAFILDNYDWNSGDYSTWTESTWSQFSARIFLKPSRTHEVVTLCIGIMIFIVSFCLIYLINDRSDVLFENAQSSTAALAEPTAC